MKRIEFSWSLNLLKHQIAINLSIMKRFSFTFDRLVLKIVKKNKEVMVNDDWGKWEKG